MADRLSKLLSEHLINFDPKSFLANVQGLNLRNSSLSRNVFDHSSGWFDEGEVGNVVTDWLLHFLTHRDFPERVAVRVSHLVEKKIFEDSALKELKFVTKSGYEKYSADKVEKVVLRVMREVGEEWVKKIRGGADDDLNKLFNPPSLTVSSHAIKNTRRRMEDRHVCMQSFSDLCHLQRDYKLFGVFDGHGGVEAARYASIHFPHHLATLLTPLHNTHTHGGWGLGSSVDGDSEECGVSMALEEAFKESDHLFCERSKIESNQSGCTGVVVLLDGVSGIHVGWVGDSQVVLVRGGEAVKVMNPHKPEREDERKRIVSLGGTVDFVGTWRVNGILSVSRAIGDCSFKPWISSEADTTFLPRHPLDQYLVIACDGLWDVLSFDDVIQHVTDHMSDHVMEDKSKRCSVAASLVKAAKEKGSQDNITVVVVFLDEDGGGQFKGGDKGRAERGDKVKGGLDKMGSKDGKSGEMMKGSNGGGGSSSISGSGVGSGSTKSSGASKISEQKDDDKDGNYDQYKFNKNHQSNSKNADEAVASESPQTSSNDDSKKNYLGCSDDSSSGDGRCGRSSKKLSRNYNGDENKENLSGNSPNLITVSENSENLITISGDSPNLIAFSGQSGDKNIDKCESGNLDRCSGGGKTDKIIKPTHHPFPKSSQNLRKPPNKAFVSAQRNYLTQTRSVVSSQQQLKHHHQQQKHQNLKTSLSTKSLFQRLPAKLAPAISKERWTVAVETGEDLQDIFYEDADHFNVVSAKW